MRCVSGLSVEEAISLDLRHLAHVPHFDIRGMAWICPFAPAYCAIWESLWGWKSGKKMGPYSITTLDPLKGLVKGLSESIYSPLVRASCVLGSRCWRYGKHIDNLYETLSVNFDFERPECMAMCWPVP